MRDETTIEQRRACARLVVLATVAFGLAAHAYCYFNLAFTHDALTSLYRQDLPLQVQLGRFMHVPYMALRGSIAAPALVGMLSLVYLSGAAYLTVRLCGLRNRALVVLACGILATNVAFTLTNASYLHESDMYMLALLLACAAVWCCERWRFGWIASAGLLALSLGFYQAYLSVAAMLFVMMAIVRAVSGEEPRSLLRSIGRMLGALVGGFVVYLVLANAAAALTGVGFASGDNGLASAGDFSNASIPVLIAQTWLYPVRYLVHPSGMYPTLVGALNVVLSLCALVGLVWLARRRRLTGANAAIVVVLLLLMPFAANYVFFPAKGVVHELMVFAFFYWYVFALQICQFLLDEEEGASGGSAVEDDKARESSDLEQKGTSGASRFALAASAIVCAVCATCIVFNVVYANQAYFKKQLQFEATEQVVNRVIDRIEQLDGYVVGKTPVYLAGSFENSPLFERRAGFEHIDDTGFWHESAITYDEEAFFEEVLGYPIELLSDEEAAALVPAQAIAAMPTFPDSDSVTLVNGVAVAKLSE